MAKNPPRKSFVEIAPSYLGGVAAIATATIAVLTFVNGRDEAPDAVPAEQARRVDTAAAPADRARQPVPDAALIDAPVVAEADAQVGPVAPGSSGDRCRRIVGAWQWYTGEIAGVLTFAEDHQVGASVARGVSPVLLGSWSCDESSGAYTIRWQNNVVERVTLADDGRTASGSNNMNMPIRGTALLD
jgi:hypothetical protein